MGKKMSETITVYEPNQRQKTGFFKIWIVMFMNIIRSRELIAQLFKRDFLAAYKKSFLGMTWIFLSPIVAIISWVFMNLTGVLNPGPVGVPYPAYVLLSSSIWGLFMGFFESASKTLSAGQSFIMQVKYPHEALLMKQIAEQLANFFLSFIITIGVLLAFGVVPHWKIVFFPLAIIPLFFFGAGIGLLVSVVNVVAMDVSKGLTMVMNLLMFVTPVIYSPQSNNHLLQKVITYNPLTYLIGMARDTIFYGGTEHPERFFYASAMALLVFLLSWRFFYLSEEKVIEKMI